jgi:hypothetical protein
MIWPSWVTGKACLPKPSVAAVRNAGDLYAKDVSRARVD